MARYLDPQKLKWGKNRMNCLGRAPFDPDKHYLAFREARPMKLRNFIAGQVKKIPESPCIPEMMKLFECMAKHEFDQSPCMSEVATYDECYNNHQKTLAAKKGNQLTSAEPVPGETKMSPVQVNTLLKRFPQTNRR